jgi:hypothetical protein
MPSIDAGWVDLGQKLIFRKGAAEYLMTPHREFFQLSHKSASNFVPLPRVCRTSSPHLSVIACADMVRCAFFFVEWFSARA